MYLLEFKKSYLKKNNLLARSEFGSWLRSFREKNGLRLYDMANTIGVTPSHLCGLETYRYCISDNIVDRIVLRYSLNKKQHAKLLTYAEHSNAIVKDWIKQFKIYRHNKNIVIF